MEQRSIWYMVYRRCRLDLLIEKYIQSLNLNGL
jgi:hypothetical protein